jgi:hypothetical protein
MPLFLEQKQVHVSSHPTAGLRFSNHRMPPFLIENFDAKFLPTGLDSTVASTYTRTSL